jgi:MFS family permease
VLGAFVVTMVGFGAAYSFAAFAVDLEASFGASRPAMTLAYAICGFTAFTISAVSGPVADRLGPRLVAATGMLLVGMGLVLASLARSLAELQVSYGFVVGLGIGVAYVPAVAAVQRGFSARRGLASGIAASGIGAATALVPAAADVLRGLGDWRDAFLVAGPLCAVLGLAGAALLPSAPAAGARRAPAMTTLLARRRFRQLYAGTLLLSIPMSLPFAHLVHTVLPDRLRPRYDAWLFDRRWRRGIIMELAPHIADRVWADGYQFAWRINGGAALGHTLDGQPTTLPVELFFSRYLA